MNLYFIAIIPHEKLKIHIKDLKSELKELYNVKHALKSPAHITLQMPFKRNADEELKLILGLEEFATKQEQFKVQLAGFSSFAPRVIYIDIKNPNPIINLHKEIKLCLLTRIIRDFILRNFISLINNELLLILYNFIIPKFGDRKKFIFSF